MAVNAMAGTEPVHSCTARPPCRVGEMPRREAMACRLKPVSGRDCIPWHTTLGLPYCALSVVWPPQGATFCDSEVSAL